MLGSFWWDFPHNFKKVEGQGSLVDAHPKKRTVPIGEQRATFELEEVE
jgi:hypothetical protein